MTPSEEFEADPFERIVNLRAELRRLHAEQKKLAARHSNLAARERNHREAMQAKLDNRETVNLVEAMWEIRHVITDVERLRVETSALNATIREIEDEIRESESGI